MNISQRDRAYEFIRNSLVSGRLPPGSRLSHRQIAKEIGTSFIPVREAIRQLVTEGLVRDEPKTGSYVMEVSRQELAELYDLREALETHAVVKAAERIRPAELAEIQRACEQMEAILDEFRREGAAAWTSERNDEWMMADVHLHLTLLRAAGNRRALKAVSDLRVMTHVFGHRVAERQVDDLERICRQHRALFDALRQRDAAAARAVLVEHLRTGCQHALDGYDQFRLREANAEIPGIAPRGSLRSRIHEMETESEKTTRPAKKTSRKLPASRSLAKRAGRSSSEQSRRPKKNRE